MKSTSTGLEVELERTTKHLREAISIAEMETKCKAAKGVIKSLTTQVRVLLL